MKTLYRFLEQRLSAPVAALVAAAVTFIAQYIGVDESAITDIINTIVSNFDVTDMAVPAAMGFFAYGLRETPTESPITIDEPVVLTNEELTEELSELYTMVEQMERDMYKFSPPTYTDRLSPRNVRNNNPLNIIKGMSNWAGQSPKQTDPKFVTFHSPVYGLRAAVYLLRLVYFRKHRLNTVRSIIKRWAPTEAVGGDNTTLQVNAYIQFVAGRLDLALDDYVTADDPLDLDNDELLILLVKAMGEFEGGEPLPYAYETYEKAINLLPREQA